MGPLNQDRASYQSSQSGVHNDDGTVIMIVMLMAATESATIIIIPLRKALASPVRINDDPSLPLMSVR